MPLNGSLRSVRLLHAGEQGEKDALRSVILSLCQEEFYCELIVHGKRTAAEFYMAHFHFFVERDREREILRRVREVQLDLTPEIELFYMKFERSHTKIKGDLSNKINFRSNVQLDHYVDL